MLEMIVWATAIALPAQQPAPQQAQQQTPPNIVYIMADELGYYELSCMGHRHIQTPHLDRMAAEGMRFTQYLAGAPVCAPTRACLMTGKHAGHTSVRSNGGGTPLRADEVTVATLLRQRGYATGGFGKWGCGGRGSTGVPERHGFDTFVGYYDQVHAHSYYPPYLIENGEELPLEGNRGGRSGATYSHYVIHDRAMQFVRDHRDGPFFCYLPITPPHGMFDIPDSDPAWKRYADKEWPEDARRYAAMVTMIDRQVGEMLALLRELGLEDNTLVIFSGDNGGNDYFTDARHPRGFHAANVDPGTGTEFRGTKGKLYEGGLRVPMIVRWPGHIEANSVSTHLCYFPDFLPTAADLAGAEPPSDIDGLSLLPTLLGKPEEQQAHPYLYWEFVGQTAVRRGDWKLIRTGKDKSWELYDLETDISEAQDLAAEHPDIVRELKALAKAAHEPCVEGTFAGRDLHDKDRRAKWGPDGRPGQSKVHRLEADGLIANAEWRIVRASSESRANGKLAAQAIDGDPRTIWHSRWQADRAEHPHELVIDLGSPQTIRGFACLARQDRGWNGAIARCTFAVSNDPETFPAAISATLKRTKATQTIPCDPVTGRYVRLRILSEVNGGPWASLAELGVIGGE